MDAVKEEVSLVEQIAVNSDVRVMAVHMQHLRGDMNRLSESLAGINENLQVLARLEQGHSVILDKLRDGAARMADHETRLNSLERDMPGLVELRRWVVWGVLSGVGMMGASLLKLTLIDPVAAQRQIIENQAPKSAQVAKP